MAGRLMYVPVMYIVAGTLASATNFLCTPVDDDGTSKNYTACPDGSSNADAKIRAIDEAFGRSNITDVVFLIDRSKSMSEASFKTTKNVITTLMDYLMRRRLVYLHPDYTRVSVASFGEQSMTVFDGINSDSGFVHACNFDDKLLNIKLGTTGRDDTNMNSAFNVAEEMFLSNSRNGADKILWVFTDGDTDCSSATIKFKEQGITVFSAGVGEWMNVAKRENAVKYLAKDTYHYACAEHWKTIIDNAISDDVGAGENEPALYVADDTYTYGKCSSCPSLQRCVCNVLDRSYTCAGYDEATLDDAPEDVGPTGGIHLTGTILTLLIIAGSATVFLCLLVVCCICCCRRRRSQDDSPVIAPRVPPRTTVGDDRAQSDNNHVYYNSGMVPPEVKPRVPPRKAGSRQMSDDGSSTQGDYYNTGQIESSRPDVVPQQEVGSHAVDEVEAETDINSGQRGHLQFADGEQDQSDNWLNQQVGLDMQQELHVPGTCDDLERDLSPQASINYSHAYDQILTGPVKSRRRVVETARKHDLQGLLIYDTDEARHWAATSRFILPPAEINTIRQLLRLRDSSTNTVVSVSGKTYTIDQTEFSDIHLHATNGQGEHLWVAIQDLYIIVGVAGPKKSKACENVVFNFMRHLEQSDHRKDESTF